jgi:predicted AlkP superfamily pyrophosphatase or phosphodiesterase
MRRLSCFIAIIVTFLFALPAFPAPQKPKLVLAIVIDQFRYDYLLRFRKDYTSGFVRMLQHGACYTDAHYLHALTVTAEGHSTFLSGATPSISGIVGNEWYDRRAGKSVTSVSDDDTKLISSAGGTGSSPRKLLVDTVGDELKMQGGDSKVIGISIKDRSAILPAGHMADAAYWYDNDANEFVTSSYYRDALPEWAASFNKEGRYRRTIGAQWVPFEIEGGKPFCTMVSGGSLRYCGAIEATPWGNELIEEFAESAIAGEKLGKHQSTDVLAVSFSSNDYVGHALGPDSPEVRDISIRTDRLLGKLFAYAEAQVGPDNTLIVITADHGVAPVPEVNQARKMPGGRLNNAEMAAQVSDALSKRFGPGKWIVSGGPTAMYLNLDLMAKLKADPAEVERVAAEALAGEQHIARVLTRHDLETGRVQQDAIGRAMTLQFFGPRSGDVFAVTEPYYMFDASGTTHGTPYDYDTHVPLMILGPGIKPGVYSRNVAINDVAPTLAAILGIETPSGSVGHVLMEVMQ